MEVDKNPENIKNMFDELASYYDKMNNLISLGQHYRIKSLAIKLLKLRPKEMVLDICCGTGDIARIISQLSPRTKVISMDFSDEMLKIARQKNEKGAYIPCDVTDLSFSDGEFDVVTCAFGLRNIQDRKSALNEIYRVLKPNGEFLHLDFGAPNKLTKIFDFVVPLIVKLLKGNSAHYKYLIASKNEYPEPSKLIEEFEAAGFKFSERHDYLFGTISAIIVQKEG